MNLLEHYIEEVYSVEPYEEEWTKKFPQHTYVKVSLTYNCYGSINYRKIIFRTEEWEKNQKQGYYMA